MRISEKLMNCMKLLRTSQENGLALLVIVVVCFFVSLPSPQIIMGIYYIFSFILEIKLHMYYIYIFIMFIMHFHLHMSPIHSFLVS